jgi:hypothetical protein
LDNLESGASRRLTNDARPVLPSILFHACKAASGARNCRANLVAVGLAERRIAVSPSKATSALNPKTEIGEHARLGRCRTRPRVRRLRVTLTRTLGTFSCARCSPRGRGKPRPRRARSLSISEFGFNWNKNPTALRPSAPRSGRNLRRAAAKSGDEINLNSAVGTRRSNHKGSSLFSVERRPAKQRRRPRLRVAAASRHQRWTRTETVL